MISLLYVITTLWYDNVITSFSCQNNIITLFWHHDDVIMILSYDIITLWCHNFIMLWYHCAMKLHFDMISLCYNIITFSHYLTLWQHNTDVYLTLWCHYFMMLGYIMISCYDIYTLWGNDIIPLFCHTSQYDITIICLYLTFWCHYVISLLCDVMFHYDIITLHNDVITLC